MKIDADEKELLESVERGEWKSAGGGKRERARFSRYAKATFKKDRRLNIRLSSKDLEAIQKRALAEGLPYQTLIASLLHKYAAGRVHRPASSARTLAQVERDHIVATLQATNGVLGGWDGAAARLGLSRTTLISRMQRLGISAGSGLRKLASKPDVSRWRSSRGQQPQVVS
jgi:predicted DNA binding CopG/RHH family protein